ncbi:unnamed protein product, partial [Meganyctiphanes norvegica]
MPKISEILFSIGKAKWYTNLDLLSAYWSIPLAEDSTHLTAFSTHKSRYEFRRCVMGLTASASVFTKALHTVLEGLLDTYDQNLANGKIFYYMDDLIIVSNDKESNLEKLDLILSRLVKYKLKIKLKKCNFLQDKVEFLGHQINFDGITPISNNILKINKFAPPQTKTQLQSFLGLVNYYRNYIPNIAKLATPLYELLGKNKIFQWSPDANTAFDNIKDKLTSGVKLFHPNPGKPFILHTDSSDDSISAILSQK